MTNDETIIRRKKNDSGFSSEWVVIPKGKMESDVVKEYWLIDISVGVIIEPWFDGSFNMLKFIYEMEEDKETLRRCINVAERQTMKELFGEE